MNLQFNLLKEEGVGILVYILSATMQYNKRQEKKYLPRQFDLSLSCIFQTRWLVQLPVADTVVVLLSSGKHYWAYASQQIPNLCSTALQ